MLGAGGWGRACGQEATLPALQSPLCLPTRGSLNPSLTCQERLWWEQTMANPLFLLGFECLHW